MRDNPLVLVVLSRRELNRAGISAKERYDLTGHDRPLSPHWARTSGMWAIRPAAEIATAAGVTPGALRKFKHDHRLRTAEDIRHCVVSPALFLAEACYSALEEHKDRPCGAAAALVAPELGVLPVEVVLHHRAMAARLGELGVGAKEWRQMPAEHRSLWFAKTPTPSPIRT